MRILLVHNYYKQSGGEDRVFESEYKLLKAKGHQVQKYVDYNQRIDKINKLQLGIETLWSLSSRKKLIQFLHKFQPEIIHFHNIFPLLSPSVYYLSQDLNIPIVQTLHNYRLLCPGATFYRYAQVCEECLGNSLYLPAVKYGCYHHSRVQTVVLTSMLTFHKFLNTWYKKINLYITLTNFAREKFISGGFPSENIVVKPNFVYPDPGIKAQSDSYVLFIGRLSMEKGIKTLLFSFKKLESIPLKIAGAGPLLSWVSNFVLTYNRENIRVLGHLNSLEVFKFLKNSRFLVFPSESYEGFPLTLIEAFATGTPVIASRLGSMAEIVT